MRKIFSHLAHLAMASALAAVAVPAAAQFAKPEDAVKYRQSSLSVMGTHFSRVGAMANGRVPFDAKVAAENAELVASLSKLPWAAFGPGTDKVGNTKAKAEVWTEQAKYKEAAEKMMGETTKLAAAARTGSLDTLKTAFGATAASCKACHDAFRSQ